MRTAPKPPIDPPSIIGSDEPLTREALAWLVHLHSGEETEQDWASYQDWKAFDDDHSRAAERAEKLWERLGPVLLKSGRQNNPRIPVIAAAIISLAALGFAADRMGLTHSLLADFRSSVGEIRTVQLRDAEVELDTGTSFDADLQQRTLTLYAGQIFVTTRPGAKPPFTVKAGTTTTQALGTAFGVRKDGDDVNVVVTEHAVRVTSGSDQKLASADVRAGEAVGYSTNFGLGQTHTADLSELTAWRRGELVFNNKPLGDVVTEFGRYRWGKVVFLDATLTRLPVTGTYDVHRFDEFLESLQIALPVKVTSLPGLTLVRRDGSKPLRN